MKAAQVSKYGAPSEVLSVATDVPKPPLKKGQMMVRVHACSLAAGDSILFQGLAKFMLAVKEWPYIPGMDICGVVEEVQPDSKFKVGDCIVATNGFMPQGGMAEYAAVDEQYAVLKPENVSVLDGAAAPVSSMTAMRVVEKAKVKAGERVLVIGGSGGVGSMVIQFARLAGASYVAATSTDKELCERLGCDRVIDYRTEKWWELAEYKEKPFDAVFDCHAGADWKHAQKSGLKPAKEGGRYLGVAYTEIKDSPIDGFFSLVSMMCGMLSQQFMTMINSSKPKWVMYMNEPKPEDREKLMRVLSEGKVKIALDPDSPFAFTKEGMVAAFQKMVDRRAHGKVVVDLTTDS